MIQVLKTQFNFVRADFGTSRASLENALIFILPTYVNDVKNNNNS